MTEIKRIVKWGRLGGLLVGLLVAALLVAACTPAQTMRGGPVSGAMPVPGSSGVVEMEATLSEGELDEGVAGTVAEAQRGIQAAGPMITILSPSEDAVLLAGDIEFTVSIEGFKLVALGSEYVLGEGHLHYYLDTDAPIAQGMPAVTAAGTYKVSVSTSVIWENVLPGEHTFSVQLVNSDHTPLETPVVASVTVTVLAGETVPEAYPMLGEPAYSY